VVEVEEMLAAGAVLLDVREDDEWADGHAPEAVHLPMWQLSERAAELPKDRTIICICHVGARSAGVAEALSGAGWKAVNLTGGMIAWERAGLPVVQDD
jgi:rhodanese-related sulfurtransferase